RTNRTMLLFRAQRDLLLDDAPIRRRPPYGGRKWECAPDREGQLYGCRASTRQPVDREEAIGGVDRVSSIGTLACNRDVACLRTPHVHDLERVGAVADEFNARRRGVFTSRLYLLPLILAHDPLEGILAPPR